MAWIQRLLAAVGAVVIAFAAFKHWWPFDAAPRQVGTYDHPSVWQFLLSDRYVLGAVRLGLAAFALYVALSVLPLMADARWAKGFGTTGVTVDDAIKASDTLEDYEQEVADVAAKLDAANETIGRVTHQRDAAMKLVRAVTATSTSAPGVTPPTIEEEGTTDDANRDQPEAGDAEPTGEAD